MAREKRAEHITLNEVARLAGVHPSTVSRVLSASPGVGDATRARVRQVVQALDYHPSVAARNLVTNTTETIGIVIPRGSVNVFQNPFYFEIFRGVGDVVNAEGYHILLETGASTRPVTLFKDRRVDGLIIVSPSIQDPNLTELAYEGYPFVVIGRPASGNTSIMSVEVNDRQGALRATRHLLESGHSRIGYIGGPLTHASGVDRLSGYRDALDGAGVGYKAELVTIEDGFVSRNGISGIKKLLRQGITAMFAFNDLMALGAIEGAKEEGVAVPDGLAVVGFDDILLASYCSPTLTTVRQPAFEKGAIAAQMLLAAVRGETVKEKQVQLPGELVVRRSCGC